MPTRGRTRYARGGATPAVAASCAVVSNCGGGGRRGGGPRRLGCRRFPRQGTSPRRPADDGAAIPPSSCRPLAARAKNSGYQTPHLTRKTHEPHREKKWETYWLKELKGLPPREHQVFVGANQAAP